MIDLEDKDDRYTSKKGYCYGVEDGLDGYCVHDPRCPYHGKSWTGPNWNGYGGRSCVRPKDWDSRW